MSPEYLAGYVQAYLDYNAHGKAYVREVIAPNSVKPAHKATQSVGYRLADAESQGDSDA